MITSNSKVIGIKFETKINGKWYKGSINNPHIEESETNILGDLYFPDFTICDTMTLTSVDDNNETVDCGFTLQIVENGEFDYDASADERMTNPLLPLTWHLDEDGFINPDEDELSVEFRNFIIITENGDFIPEY